jgi:hypothetical protein
MSARTWLPTFVAVVWLAGCATPPPAVTDVDEEPVTVASPSTPMVEYPPIEPVEPPAPAAEPPAAVPEPLLPVLPPTVAPVSTPAPVPSALPEPPTDEQQLMALLADLMRYGALAGDDLKRELNAATQALARQRTDANRVRLAVLYTLAKSSPQDDQRALQLFENVAKSNPGSLAIKQLAAVLQAQVSERLRSVRDEQLKADAALQKLEGLRAIDRQLLRERFGGGGGGGGGGAGSGSGSGK